MTDSVHHRYVARHWPFIVAFAAWLLLVSVFSQSEIVRAVVAVACIALMFVQWQIYRNASRGAHLAFLSLVSIGFGLANIWLALNVARFYTYDGDAGSGLHMSIIRIQDALLWILAALAAFISVWVLFATVRWFAKRMAAVAR
ncbi:MAG TPA: hypothetical protein VN622_03715 [Clostridia bacterium]|nr:hypothetical protein [Clostridia bacterium]